MQRDNTNQQWIHPAVTAAFTAAIPASQASGDYAGIWPYTFYDAANGVWVAFNSLAELEAATMPVEATEQIR